MNWLPLLLFTLLILLGVTDTRAADGTVTGKVTGPNGTTALANIQVRGYLWDDDEEIWSEGGIPVVTNASGNYSLQLPPGEYVIGFRDPAGNYAEEYYDDEWHISNATRFQVVSSQTVSSKNASLATAARISGTITSTGGGPAGGVEVRSYLWDDEDEYWAYGPATTTASNGTYNLGGLTPGVHLLRFLHPTGAYFGSFYGGGTNMDDATSVPAAAGITVTGINGSLAPAGRISGTVTGAGGAPLGGVYVRVHQWNVVWQEWDWIAESETLANGTYFVGLLKSGVYRVDFYDEEDLYNTECYNNVGSLDLAADVSVAVGSTTGGINALLSERGKISGTVTGPNGVTPVAGAQVTPYIYDSSDDSWYAIRSVFAAANGTYLLPGLPAGPVRLRFSDPTALHFTEFHNNVATVGQAQNITVSNGTTVTGINASLARSGSVSGTVTGPNGVPLASVAVEVNRWNPVWQEWDWVAGTDTSGGGSYTVGGLITGIYRVAFYDYSGKHLNECYNNAPDLDSAADVSVTTGLNTGGINASLAEKGKISGKVTAANGVTPLSGIRVIYYIYDENNEEWYSEDDVTSAADGTYLLTALPTGTVRVRFWDPSGIYFSEYYNNAANVESGTDVPVSPGTTTSGINASLDRAGSISGLVTGPNGTTPLNDVEVTVYRWDASEEYWEWVESSYTENGLYTVGGLTTGSYRVGFWDENGIHATEYYNNAPDLSSATPVAVTMGLDTGGINASLATRGKISGKVTAEDGVTPLAGILVTYYQYDEGDEEWYSEDDVTTAADGTYQLSGLPNGVVRIGFRHWEQTYVEDFYQNVATVEEGTDITVSTGNTIPGINASLAMAGSIAGTVTGPDGVTRLRDVYVNAYQWNSGWEGWDWVNSGYTAANGSYLVKGLAAGSYRIEFYDENNNHRTEFYNNATSLESATDVSVSLNTVTGNINASLQLAGSISGTVTGLSSTPVEDVYVSLYVWNAGLETWERIRTTYTHEDGIYRFWQLVPGIYRVGFTDEYNFYVSEFYNGGETLQSATDIVIATATTATGIDTSLVIKGRISGKVTAPDGITPLDDISITVYQYDASEDYWEEVAYAYTRSNGVYLISGLNPGAVRLCFSDSSGGFLTEYYNNVSSLQSANDITVSNGTIVSGVNASLGAAGRITGKVTGPDGTSPLDDIEVSIYRWDADFENWDPLTYVYTREDGTYRLGGLQPGLYRLGFVDEGNYEHASEFYNNAATVVSAADIPVTAGSVVSGINVALELKGRVSGKVTGPDGVTPIQDAQVTAYQYDEWGEWRYDVRTIYTKADGTYTLAGLAPGPIRIRFQDENGDFTEYYNNSPNIEGAQDVSVPVSGEVAGINASLGVAEPVAPSVLGFKKTGTGTWELQFSGGQGSVYQLQDSTDLRVWRDVGSSISGASGVNTLPLATDGPKRFWRVRTVP